nr:MAG TPA: hypothetical protein [Caudoviricetes sp.]
MPKSEIPILKTSYKYNNKYYINIPITCKHKVIIKPITFVRNLSEKQQKTE